MGFLKSTWCISLLTLIILILIFNFFFINVAKPPLIKSADRTFATNKDWKPPKLPSGLNSNKAKLIIYGRELISHTSRYLGKKGSVLNITNGMNCQNCHLDEGTKAFANPFSAVAANYPRYRDRSGRMETIQWRINECMQRSLGGKPLDSNSREMKAMVSYLLWIGSEVPKNMKPKGIGTESLPFLARAADPHRGSQVYLTYCRRCHGQNGEGFLAQDSTAYIYPPLWGPNSYNVSAGMYQISKLAGFIKGNMPFGAASTKPLLTDAETWDVAAFINSQPRPLIFFPHDWPDIAKKPIDYPFGPYTDNFSEKQHKYGPFEPIQKTKAKS